VTWQVILKARRILIIKETIIQGSRDGSIEKLTRTFGSGLAFFPFIVLNKSTYGIFIYV
jgi:hypothetical protein